MKRKAISKKTRFEVFKRDGFKCVYCGACAPEAVLVVDHIDPLAKGGADEIVNYATACQPCNAGKSDRKLGDNTVLQKQRRQLDELSERREQLEMLLEWRNGLQANVSMEVDAICEAFERNTFPFEMTEEERVGAKKLLRKYSLSQILDAVEIAAESYLKRDAEGDITPESMATAWKKVGGVLALQAMPDAQRRLYYVQGILRNRLHYVPRDAVSQMLPTLEAGVDVEEIVAQAKKARNWTEFRAWLLG